MLKKMSLFTFSVLVLIVTLFFPASTLHAQSYSIKPIVTLFDKIEPDSKLFVRYINSLGGLAINNNGNVVFPVLLSDLSTAIMSFSNDKLEFLVKAKGFTSATDDGFLHVDVPDINDNGTVAFFGVPVNSNLETRIFKIEGDKTFSIAGPGDSILGLDATINSLCCSQSMSINNNGDVAFVANLTDGSYGLFIFSEGEIKPVIVFGKIQDAPVIVDGNEVLRLFGFVSEINDKGEIAFGVDLPKGLGVLFYTNGEIVTVLIPGDEAPGTNGNVFSGGIIPMALNNNSEIVFYATVITPGGSSDKPSDRQGIGYFFWNGGETEPLILTGEELPGIEGETFAHLATSGFLTKGSLNDSGETVISLGTTSQKSGLFILSKEDIVPVILPETTSGRQENQMQITVASINNQGDIIFEGFVNSGGLRGASQSGLFMAIQEE